MKKHIHYWGIDVGNAKGTIFCKITKNQDKWHAQFITINNVSEFWTKWKGSDGPIAIDAPLTYAPNNSSGFREIDMHWKECLKGVFKKDKSNWVLSPNSIRTLPIKGLWLINEIGCESVIECHPRVGMSLFFQDAKSKNALDIYKYCKKKDSGNYTKKTCDKARKHLWDKLCSYVYPEQPDVVTDDHIDAFFCALLCLDAHEPSSPLKSKDKGIYFQTFENGTDEQKFNWIKGLKQMKHKKQPI